jgi:predicted nucleic acid-binding protein
MTPWPLLAYTNRTPSFILDVSVASAWLLLRRATKYTSDVQWHLVKDAVAVPSSWFSGLAETLLAAEQNRETTRAKIDQFLMTLAKLSILIDDETEFRAWKDTLDLARVHSITVANAAYLELALRVNLPLATIDPALSRAATAAGTSILSP